LPISFSNRASGSACSFCGFDTLAFKGSPACVGSASCIAQPHWVRHILDFVQRFQTFGWPPGQSFTLQIRAWNFCFFTSLIASSPFSATANHCLDFRIHYSRRQAAGSNRWNCSVHGCVTRICSTRFTMSGH
jgi:hypothetical protein